MLHRIVGFIKTRWVKAFIIRILKALVLFMPFFIVLGMLVTRYYPREIEYPRENGNCLTSLFQATLFRFSYMLSVLSTMGYPICLSLVVIGLSFWILEIGLGLRFLNISTTFLSIVTSVTIAIYIEEPATSKLVACFIIPISAFFLTYAGHYIRLRLVEDAVDRANEASIQAAIEAFEADEAAKRAIEVCQQVKQTAYEAKQEFQKIELFQEREIEITKVEFLREFAQGATAIVEAATCSVGAAQTAVQQAIDASQVAKQAAEIAKTAANKAAAAANNRDAAIEAKKAKEAASEAGNSKRLVEAAIDTINKELAKAAEAKTNVKDRASQLNRFEIAIKIVATRDGEKYQREHIQIQIQQPTEGALTQDAVTKATHTESAAKSPGDQPIATTERDTDTYINLKDDASTTTKQV